jgi:hypothetical protein
MDIESRLLSKYGNAVSVLLYDVGRSGIWGHLGSGIWDGTDALDILDSKI